MIVIPPRPSLTDLVGKIKAECPYVSDSESFEELELISEEIDKIREFFQHICEWMDSFEFRAGSRMGGYKAKMEEYFREKRC